MSVREERAILDAYENGEVIEWKMRKDELWTYSASKEEYGDDYGFDFVHCEYRVKPKRRRVQKNEVYYYIYSDGSIIMATDTGLEVDGDRFMFGNYFKTEYEAKEAHDLLQKCLLNYHEYNDTKRND